MTAERIRFTTLVRDLRTAHPEQPRAFHILAARYYLGADSLQDLLRQAAPYPVSLCRRTGQDQLARPVLSARQLRTILGKR